MMTSAPGRTIALAGAIALSLAASPPVDARRPKATIANPLLPSGADPWIVRQADTYFYMNTEFPRERKHIGESSLRRTKMPGISGICGGMSLNVTVWISAVLEWPKSGIGTEHAFYPECLQRGLLSQRASEDCDRGAKKTLLA